MTMTELKSGPYDYPCCGPSSDYPCGFFLSTSHMKDLGLQDVEAGVEMEVMVKVKMTSVTKKEDGSAEGYMAICAMDTGKGEKPATKKMAEAYDTDTDD